MGARPPTCLQSNARKFRASFRHEPLDPRLRELLLRLLAIVSRWLLYRRDKGLANVPAQDRYRNAWSGSGMGLRAIRAPRACGTRLQAMYWATAKCWNKTKTAPNAGHSPHSLRFLLLDDDQNRRPKHCLETCYTMRGLGARGWAVVASQTKGCDNRYRSWYMVARSATMF